MIETLAVEGKKVNSYVQFALLFGIAISTSLFHQQLITGTIVNATLFVATGLLGTPAAMVIGLFPSVIALSAGLLPTALAPVIPFIMISNAFLILSFALLKKNNYWFGAVIASLIKFVFLFGSSFVVMNLILQKDMAFQVAAMTGWIQLVTAIMGAILANFYTSLFKPKS
jgi:hypothetical protein